MIGFKAAYNGKIEYGIDISTLKGNEVIVPGGKINKEARNGFSLFKNKEDLLESFFIKGMKFFQVESVGKVEFLDDKSMLVTGFENAKEISRESLAKFIFENQDMLFKNKNPLIRKSVVSLGYKLEDALKDEAAIVRAEVANHGKFLDVLENDKSVAVLYAVVKQNHNLEKFLKHDDYDIRTEAKTRYKALNAIGAN